MKYDKPKELSACERTYEEFIKLVHEDAQNVECFFTYKGAQLLNLYDKNYRITKGRNYE